MLMTTDCTVTPRSLEQQLEAAGAEGSRQELCLPSFAFLIDYDLQLGDSATHKLNLSGFTS